MVSLTTSCIKNDFIYCLKSFPLSLIAYLHVNNIKHAWTSANYRSISKNYRHFVRELGKKMDSKLDLLNAVLDTRVKYPNSLPHIMFFFDTSIRIIKRVQICSLFLFLYC